MRSPAKASLAVIRTPQHQVIRSRRGSLDASPTPKHSGPHSGSKVSVKALGGTE